ncbi:MAG: hypothetical protein ACT6FF_07460 [Methanosarcinaceae archaeon]
MKLLIIFTFLVIAIFGCSSISQSFASAKQSEAAIEASRTAQLALGGQIAISILLALVVVILVFIILAFLYHLSKKKLTPSQFQINRFSQDDFSVSSNMDVDALCQFPVLRDETESNSSILPSGWGW